MAKVNKREISVRCDGRMVNRVYLNMQRGKVIDGIEVKIGALLAGDVYKSTLSMHKGAPWQAAGVSTRQPKTQHKTALAAVRALVCRTR